MIRLRYSYGETRVGAKVQSVAAIGVLALGMAVLGFLAILSVISTAYYRKGPFDESVYINKETVLWRWDNPFLNLAVLLVFAAALCLLFWLCRRVRVNYRALHIAGTALVAAAGVLWVLLVRVDPYLEPGNILQNANAIYRGDYSAFEEGGYFHLFPFQLGYAALQHFIVTWFGPDNYMVSFLLNAACAALVYSLSLRITFRLFRDEDTLFAAVLLMLGCFYLVMYTGFIYGILPSLALSMLALWCVYRYFDTRRLPALLFGAVAIALAVLFKSNSSIFAIGMGIILLLDFIKKPGMAAPAAVLAFFIALAGIQGAMHAYYRNLTGIEISSGTPSAVWVAMGLKDDSEMGYGQYNTDTYNKWPGNGYDSAATAREAAEDIRAAFGRMGGPGGAAFFFGWKAAYQWNEPTLGAFLTGFARSTGERSALAESVYYGRAYEVLRVLMKSAHLIILCGAFMCLILRRRRLTVYQMGPLIILIGGFLFHTFLWEAKSQYSVSYFLLAVPYAAAGYACLCGRLLKLAGKIWARLPFSGRRALSNTDSE